MSVYQETMDILKKYKIKANKSLGQNFLIDEIALSKIVEAGNITKDDIVIEIGPGLGTLTKLLLEKAKKVIVIELDERMIKILQDRFKFYDNLEIIHGDVLKIDLEKLIKENTEKRAKIVANLPYYITTPIIMKLLEEKLQVESITIMIQREVAKRLVAHPGTKECSAITYTIYYYTKAEEIAEVQNTSFIPAPEVDSEVIKLTIREKPEVEVKNEKEFISLIRKAFTQRRKTLVNAITNNNIIKKEELIPILQKLQISEKARAENLSIEEFAKLYKEIYK